MDFVVGSEYEFVYTVAIESADVKVYFKIIAAVR